GNYVLADPNWNGNRGAVTWGSGTTGVSGTVSEANSLVGSSSNDYVGSGAVFALSNGNYVVTSLFWSASRGAVTWGNGSTGVTGTVSEANSLIGSAPGEYTGSNGITVLSNGNYVVRSTNWNGGRAAVTWGSGTQGVQGVISEANSLVGSNLGDSVGYVLTLSNGNYVVYSPFWSGARGAVTWGDGTTAIHGTVSDRNSLVGSSPGDQVGMGYLGVVALSNGSYVVQSPTWNGNRGAVTWGSGTQGVTGPVSEANSLVGSNPGDLVGMAAPLTNGNYVVLSASWDASRGAATWGSGTQGVTGPVSEANSLVGSHQRDGQNSRVLALTNGNYIVSNPSWNAGRGAATWA